jgi:energy-coupling factor transporter transmembrane protein EcfT
MIVAIFIIGFAIIGFIIGFIAIREIDSSIAGALISAILGIFTYIFIFQINDPITTTKHEKIITFTNENVQAFQKETKKKNGELFLKDGEHYFVENFQMDENTKYYIGKYYAYSSFEKFFFAKEDTAMKITSFYDDSAILTSSY